MKTALVHDYLNQAGGAERVVESLHEMYPASPIFTSFYDKKRMPEIFKSMDIRTSFMQHLPFIITLFKRYLPLYPFAFESFDLSEYDLIVSSSAAWGKGVKKRERATHICYCHSPMRFVWMRDSYLKKEKFGLLKKIILHPVLEWLKRWDIKTSKNVDHFIANSAATAKRIKLFYGRDAAVIHPPVDTSFFKPYNGEIKDFFLIVSRLNSYKQIDLAIEAFNGLGLPLYIIGKGPDEKRLKGLAKPNIRFLGKLPDDEIVKYYSQCRAYILPGEEDFGLTPVEAQACGRPVIAFRAGGSLESVKEGVTGLFLDRLEISSLIETVRKFGKMSFDASKIRAHALMFDKEVFKRKMGDFIGSKTRS